jgi:hypothetical protein
VSSLIQRRSIDCLTLCHASATGSHYRRLESPNACQDQSRGAVHAIAVRSFSIIERTVTFCGASDDEEFHFDSRLEEKHRFDGEFVVPARAGRAKSICLETMVPILPRDIVFEAPVRIASTIDILIAGSTPDETVAVEVTLMPEAQE